MEVDSLGSPSLIVLTVSVCGRKATMNLTHTPRQLRSSVKVEEAVLVVRTIRGCKTTFEEEEEEEEEDASDFTSCVKVEVAILDSPSLTGLKVSVDV